MELEFLGAYVERIEKRRAVLEHVFFALHKFFGGLVFAEAVALAGQSVPDGRHNDAA